MKLTDRDRRALLILAVVAIPLAGWYFLSDDGPQVVSVSTESIPAAEKRLQRLKQQTAAVPGKEQVLASVSAELAARERGLVQADTAPQAQAQLLQIVRRIARSQKGPIELRNTEIGQVKPFGDRYGEVAVAINFEAGIEQLLSFLADLTAQKELIGTSEIRIGAANPRQKTMPVRMLLTALVRRELVPEKKGTF